MVKKTVLLVMSLLLLVLPALAQSEDMSEPQISYMVCDWGLVTIEESTEQGPIFIEITSPEDYSAVEGISFTVSGTGAGLFEGNVVVEISGPDGDVLFEAPTVLQAEEMGAVGDWSINIDLGELESNTRIFVRAYSTSPEDGSTIAFDSLRLNANSEFGLRYVDITTPYFGAGVNTSPLLIEGMAGGAFENNIVIEVRNFETKEILAETPATVETEDFAGSGPFSAEVTIEAEPGQAIEVYAYQPSVADGEEVEISDIEFAIVSPLAQSYDRILILQRDDPILGAEEMCAVAEAEFDNTNTDMLVINDVAVLSTRSMMPLVTVSIDAAGSSNCAAPLRTRVTHDGDGFAIEVYRDTTEPVPCTMDLAPIPVRVSLGTLPNPDYTITVNGEAVE
ncbi:MAG: hypothetical protein CL607_23665 [Anaerolineaceae bacterium]|nr:hypothetical protein [Anaerolineaceae bacterium]